MLCLIIQHLHVVIGGKTMMNYVTCTKINGEIRMSMFFLIKCHNNIVLLTQKQYVLQSTV